MVVEILIIERMYQKVVDTVVYERMLSVCVVTCLLLVQVLADLVYGCTFRFMTKSLKAYNIDVTFVLMKQIFQAYRAAIPPNTKVTF